MEEKQIDLAIVGAGAAGLMSAIWAGRTARERNLALHILLLDSRLKIGAKILMSGGGRSNVTNQKVLPSDFHGGPNHFVKHVLEAFPPCDTIRFFEGIGVKLILETGGKYFPVTHSAQTVLDALMKEMERVGVALKTGVRITKIEKKENHFCLESSDCRHGFSARKVILATGGLSYPATGCDGTGYKIAKNFAHAVVDTFPALVPLRTDDSSWKSLSGMSLKAKLSFFKNGKKESDCCDSLLLTHFGFTGPAALNISRHFAAAKKKERPQITASFLPEENEETLAAAFQAARKKSPRKLVKNFLAEAFRLPARFVEIFLKKIDIFGDEEVGKFSRENLKRLSRLLLHYPLEISGALGYDRAEVTAGGIDLREVSASTMESKLAPGLYFAGEMLDADGRIGGFNFQWAWSTGAIAGRSAVGRIDNPAASS